MGWEKKTLLTRLPIDRLQPVLYEYKSRASLKSLVKTPSHCQGCTTKRMALALQLVTPFTLLPPLLHSPSPPCSTTVCLDQTPLFATTLSHRHIDMITRFPRGPWAYANPSNS